MRKLLKKDGEECSTWNNLGFMNVYVAVQDDMPAKGQPAIGILRDSHSCSTWGFFQLLTILTRSSFSKNTLSRSESTKESTGVKLCHCVGWRWYRVFVLMITASVVALISDYDTKIH